MKMRSNRPYLLRAFFDWIVDNDCTPYVVIDAHYPGVEVPQDYVTEGQIVLNIAPRAVSSFLLDLEVLCFSTRFGGMPIDIQVPIGAVIGIYSQENGQGMVFEQESPDDLPPPPPSGPKAVKNKPSPAPPVSSGDGAPKKGRASLRVIK